MVMTAKEKFEELGFTACEIDIPPANTIMWFRDYERKDGSIRHLNICIMKDRIFDKYRVDIETLQTDDMESIPKCIASNFDDELLDAISLQMKEWKEKRKK